MNWQHEQSYRGRAASSQNEEINGFWRASTPPISFFWFNTLILIVKVGSVKGAYIRIPGAALFLLMAPAICAQDALISISEGSNSIRNEIVSPEQTVAAKIPFFSGSYQSTRPELYTYSEETTIDPDDVGSISEVPT